MTGMLELDPEPSVLFSMVTFPDLVAQHRGRAVCLIQENRQGLFSKAEGLSLTALWYGCQVL